MIITINNVNILESDIIEISKPAQEKITFNFNNLIASTLDIDIINNQQYDDDVPGALFYGNEWYNSVCTIIDDTGEYIWKGRVKNIYKNIKNKTITIKTTNYVKDIIDTVCDLQMGSAGNVTPAEIIYTLLLDVVKIPEINLRKKTFDDAAALQRNNSGYIQISYQTQDNVKCGTVIQEILKITCSDLYVSNDIVYYKQWQPYNGELGELLKESDILNTTLTSEYNDSNIYNNYNIVYKSGSNIAYATPITIKQNWNESQIKHGNRLFIIPSSKVDSTLAVDYKILLYNSTGANWYGTLNCDRYCHLKKILKLEIDNTKNYLQLYDQIDLTALGMVREPLNIIEKTYNKKKKYISLVCEYMNKPYEYIHRNSTPPSTPELLNIFINTSNSVYLKFNYGGETNIAGFKIYFTQNNNFSGEYSQYGLSPIIYTTWIKYNDGSYGILLDGLQENTNYKFRISAYNTYMIESQLSNILSTTLYDNKVSLIENFYCTKGNIYEGITLDINNSKNGYLVNGYTHYDEINYDEGTYGITGVYESPLLRGNTIILSGRCDNYNDILISYRTYNNGSFGSWSIPVSAMGFITLEPELSEFQLRVIFNSPHWSDEDMIYIEAIE